MKYQTPIRLLLAVSLLLAVGCTRGGTRGLIIGDDDSAQGAMNCAGPGYPDSVVPDSYVEEGVGLGDAAMLFDAIDQEGNDIAFEQYYGYMVLLDFTAIWCVPCQQAAEEAQAMKNRIDAAEDYGFCIVNVLIDSANGAGQASQADAAAWASLYEYVDIPVFTGPDAAQAGITYGANPLPYTVVLTPDLRIHEIESGVPAEASLHEKLNELWDEFQGE